MAVSANPTQRRASSVTRCSNVQMNLRVDEALRDRVQQAADERGVSREWFLRKLIVEGLDALKPASEIRLTHPPD